MLGEAKGLRDLAQVLGAEGDTAAARKAMHQAARLFAKAGDARAHDEAEAAARTWG